LVALNTRPVVVAATVGVPEITPAEDNERPAGRVPDCKVQVMGDVPVAESVKLYAVPTVAKVSEVVVTVGTTEDEPTVSVNILSSNPKALVARKVIDVLAVAVGVPERTPPTEKDIPVGKVPLSIAQVIGVVPVAVKVVVG
jgi:hypothetical protein